MSDNATTDKGPDWVPDETNSTSADASGAAIDITAAPASGKNVVVDDLIFATDTQMSFTLKEETSGTTLGGPFYANANTPYPLTPRNGFRVPTADKKMQLQTSDSGNISVWTSAHSE